MSFLLDTDVVSEWVKPRPNPNVVAWLADVDEDRVHLSVTTLAEIARGIDLLPPGARRGRLEAWAADDLPARFDGRILAIDRPVAQAWGALMARSQRAGVALSAMDGFIAATAQVHALTLVTHNTRHFQALGLDLLDPWQPT